MTEIDAVSKSKLGRLFELTLALVVLFGAGLPETDTNSTYSHLQGGLDSSALGLTFYRDSGNIVVKITSS